MKHKTFSEAVEEWMEQKHIGATAQLPPDASHPQGQFAAHQEKGEQYLLYVDLEPKSTLVDRLNEQLKHLKDGTLQGEERVELENQARKLLDE